MWSSFASSSEGIKLVAVQNKDGSKKPGFIYTSTDLGATYTKQTGAPAGYWFFVGSSSDGVKMVAAQNSDASSDPGFIYTSTDSGAT